MRSLPAARPSRLAFALCGVGIWLLALLTFSLLPRAHAQGTNNGRAYEQWMQSFMPTGMKTFHYHETNTTYKVVNGKQRTTVGNVDAWYRATPSSIRFDAPNHYTVWNDSQAIAWWKHSRTIKKSSLPLSYWMDAFFRPDECGCGGYYGASAFISATESTANYQGVKCRTVIINYKTVTLKWNGQVVGPGEVTMYYDKPTNWPKARVVRTWDPSGKTLVELSTRDYEYDIPLADSLFIFTTPTAGADGSGGGNCGCK